MSTPQIPEIRMWVPDDTFLEKNPSPWGEFWELRNPGGCWGYIRADYATPILIKPSTPPPPDPTPTPTPTEIKPKKIKILVGNINIRASASRTATRLGVMSPGDIGIVLSNDAPIVDGYVWRKVRFEQGNAEGWIVFTSANGTGNWAEGLET